MKRLLPILGLFLSIGFIQLSGQNMTAKLDSVLAGSIDPTGPGVTVLIRQKGETIYLKGYGMANVEQGIRMDPDQVFRIGSITKQFTACAILKLAEEGKLSLTDDIQTFLPNYPTQGQKITIEHLLTHTSGIKSYTSLPEWTPEVQRRDFTPLELIEYFKRDSLDFMPGEEFRYNNTAYFILGYIIEKVSGITYEEFIETRFFEPLGMKNSCYDRSDEIIHNRVSGYEKKETLLKNADFLSMTQPYAAGSLMSTVSDLSRWYQAVFEDRVILPESRRKAHTSFVLNNGKSTGYGFGWFIGNQLDRKTIEHGGGINGSLTKDLYFPDEDLFVAVFSNCSCFRPDPLAVQLAAKVLQVDLTKKEVVLTKEQMERLVGKYEFMEGFVLTITLDGQQLMAQATGQGIIPIFAESETRFFLKVVDAQLEFVLKGNQAKSVILYQGPAKLEGKRVN